MPDVNYWYMQISEYVQLQPLDEPVSVMKENGFATKFVGDLQELEDG